MKKYFLLLLFTAISYAQTNGVTKLKITANPEKTAATRVVVQDAATGEVGYVNKTTIVTLDATNTTTGKIQLSGDLGGTATLPTVPGLATKENTIAPGTTSQYYRGDKTWQTLDKTAVGLANVDNTSDLNKPISTATQTALNLKENTANKNTANGYAGLGSDGKLISNQLPAITITDTFVVGSQSAMLSLVAETGDVAVRTDVNKSFILQGDTPSDLADWQELLTPTSTVSSVFGRTGAVTANSGDYTADQISETASRKFQSLEQKTYNDATSSIQTQLNGKVSLTGTETIAGAKTFSSTPSFDSNIYLKKLGSWANPANYNVIGGMTNGFVLSSGTNKHAYLDLFQITQARQFDFPDKSGTFAMTSDVPTISGTTNYLPKFTGTSALGNSLIYDDGTNVGIGTTSPGGKLHVVGEGIFDDGTNGRLTFSNASSQNDIYSTTTSFGGWKNLRLSSNELILSSGGTAERMRITSSGNVGIGTTNPAMKLQVGDGTGTGNQYIRLYSSATDMYIGQTGSNLFAAGNGQVIVTDNTYTSNLAIGTLNPSANLIFGTASTERMRIFSSGNVFIGSSPVDSGYKLDVNGYANIRGSLTGYVAGLSAYRSYSKTAQFEISSYQSAGSSPYTKTLDIVSNADSGVPSEMRFLTADSGTNPTERMRITSSGNVGIGTTNAVQKLTVSGNIAIFDSGKIILGENHSGGASLNYNPNGNLDITPRAGYNTVFTAGNITASSGSVTATGFFQSSDLRLKDIISRDGDVIKYKWKDKRDDKIHIGYVAQEVQKENPDQVNADEKGILSVNYIEILVEKIRKLEKEIELLKAK